MSDCHLLAFSPSQAPQSPEDDCFVGGKPKLPANEVIPRCGLCGATQSFFFQLSFPDGHEWRGLSLAVFACTSCSDPEHIIPAMLKGRLPGAEIPESFLESYQVNFRFLVFETRVASTRHDYVLRVAFKRFRLEPCRSDARGNKVGGNPHWIMEDETPKSYAGRTPMVFLLQFEKGFAFDTVPEAPPQIRLGLSGAPEPSPHRYYELFSANALYLFGTRDRSEPLVYALTQV